MSAPTQTSEPKDALSRVKDHFDEVQIRARVDEVLSEKLYWFPVRHHSPAVARYLKLAIKQRKPKILFIEGPHEATDLIKYIVDPKTKPPVALYCSYRDDDNHLGLAGIASAAEHIPARFASWYPMLPYSPEYVALTVAKELKIESVFMDLPFHARLRPMSEIVAQREQAEERRRLEAQREQSDDDDEPESEASVEESTDGSKKESVEQPPANDTSEKLIEESEFYRKLAEVAGYRSWNEAWDSIFEMRDFSQDIEQFRIELATFCAAARATASVERMKEDGTFERERFMLKTISETLLLKQIAPEDAMVICGGFHLFLDREDTEAPPTPPPGTTYNTIVPYSYFRVSEISGYGAGNRAPQFYQTVWDLTHAGRGSDYVTEHVISVLKRARKEGEPLSSADAIAVCQHAEMLGRLRGRQNPVLDDIHDALITCCCKGDPNEDGVHLWKAIDATDIGHKTGRVSPDLGQLPLVKDFYTQLAMMQLDEVLGVEQRLQVKLDKREEVAGHQSSLLHRLRYLKIPLATLKEASSGKLGAREIFAETWVLVWSPKVEANLIENSFYGDTIETATLAMLQEDLAKDGNHAGKISQRLVNAVDMDLPNMIQEVEDALSEAVDTDARFVSLAEALSNLLFLDRYAVLRNMRRGLLDDLIVRCFDRSCFSIMDVVAVPEDQQQNVISALFSLAEIMQRGEKQGLDRDLFIENVKYASEATEIPFLKGALLGILAELRVISPQQLAEQVALFAKSPVEIKVKAGDFLDGVMAVSRTSILLGADALIKAIDELLRACEWDDFLTLLPRTRAAIERLHDRQRESLASRVAKLYGLSEKTEELTKLATSVGAAAAIARIDAKVAQIMKEWDF